ncbi:hypothetical protein L6452_25004 [Arctium lappa]|uniref:Uncharacterized protein n=1 Tax=Arctium lappa TaxID=4217 RepID=A0ACB9A9M3_ARCLA|nr:hypothetical protein L6452_25004 [Arctium lappa]
MVIVSRDIVKPSSPTPSHQKIYNLSLLDQLTINAYIPMVTFFPSSGINRSSDNKTTKLKNSLSQTLTQYYPFAGTMPKIGRTFVECNDSGIDFIEATNHSTLSDFLQQSDHKDLNQLCPDDLIWYNPNHRAKDNENDITRPILSIQINHFACGGVAVAVSLSHKVGDASSLFNFVNHWATVTKSQS